HRQIGRLLTLENAAHVNAGQMKLVHDTGAVGHQAAFVGVRALRIYRRNLVMPASAKIFGRLLKAIGKALTTSALARRWTSVSKAASKSLTRRHSRTMTSRPIARAPRSRSFVRSCSVSGL